MKTLVNCINESINKLALETNKIAVVSDNKAQSHDDNLNGVPRIGDMTIISITPDGKFIYADVHKTKRPWYGSRIPVDPKFNIKNFGPTQIGKDIEMNFGHYSYSSTVGHDDDEICTVSYWELNDESKKKLNSYIASSTLGWQYLRASTATLWDRLKEIKKVLLQ